MHVGERSGQPDTFVITGDIPAMWLRDSTAQVWPYGAPRVHGSPGPNTLFGELILKLRTERPQVLRETL